MAATRYRNENASVSLIGWAVGLVYYEWFSSNPAHIGLLLFTLVSAIGFYITDMLVSNTVCTLAAAVSYRITGEFEGARGPFIMAAVASPILSFFAARLALHLIALISN